MSLSVHPIVQTSGPITIASGNPEEKKLER